MDLTFGHSLNYVSSGYSHEKCLVDLHALNNPWTPESK